MSSTPFGEHLKREREMRGVSLEEISAATRISTRFLEAIEKDQWEELPGGVFNRGFIRSIGRFLGLDEDGLVAAYALQTSAATEAVVAAKRTQDVPRNWQPAAIAAAAFLVLLFGGWFAYRHYGVRIAARLHRGTSGVAANSASEASSTIPSQINGSSPTDAPAVPSIATPSPAPENTADLSLKVEATHPVDVKIAADGTSLYQGPLLANEVRHFTAHGTFDINFSESSALQLELNGQAIPPSGTPGQPGQLSLTHNDLKPAAGGSH